MCLLFDFFSRPDGIHGIDGVNEDLPVAMLSGSGAGLNGCNSGLEFRFLDYKGEHNLGQLAVNGIPDLNAALLPSTEYIHFRERDDTGRLEGINDLFFSFGTNNGANHSHACISTQTWFSSTTTGYVFRVNSGSVEQRPVARSNR